MVEIPFIVFEAAFVAAWLLVRIALCARRGRVDWHRELLSLLMLVNVVAILRFTMFPFDTVGGHVQPLPFDLALAFPPRLNLVPFAEFFTYDSTRDMLVNVVGNCVMFVPTGIVLPIVYPKLDSLAKVVGVCALISLAIELVQLPFHTRVTDVNDLMLNVAGGAIGYGLYALFRGIARRARKA
ncbi:MAG: VanZ family protein [Atopobiaceae bacterium]|nr:VanZ family protein [Atopobiaceae bacterium]